MALHFVSTSILSSTEEGYNEEIKENEETIKLKKLQEKLSSRPLYEQLAEQAAKKEAEYNANTKLIFGPPKGLDEEDILFYDNLREYKEKEKEEQLLKEEKELELFRKAQKQHIPLPSPLINLSNQEGFKKTTNISKIEIVKHKRKKEHNNNSLESNNAKDEQNKSKNQKLETSTSIHSESITTNLQPNQKQESVHSGESISSLFGQYNSDNEDED
mmetsp:Transcript_16711/g.17468  ORF Transcript_16711/g.17468 Transcript_16711/m.17468 type:complete len:216 (+) Transcript_16711:59-706(+)